MKISNFKFQISSGLTLVELLIVIAIMSIILGLAIPAYNTFNRKQTLRQSGETLVQALRDAQNRATSGDSATLCGLVPAPSAGQPANYPFLGWYVTMQSGMASGKTYTLSGKCRSASNPVDIAQKPNLQFASGDIYISSITPVSPIYILFQPVSQSIRFYTDANLTSEDTSTNQAVITLTQGTQTYKITVTKSGAIYNSP